MLKQCRKCYFSLLNVTPLTKNLAYAPVNQSLNRSRRPLDMWTYPPKYLDKFDGQIKCCFFNSNRKTNFSKKENKQMMPHVKFFKSISHATPFFSRLFLLFSNQSSICIPALSPFKLERFRTHETIGSHSRQKSQFFTFHNERDHIICIHLKVLCVYIDRSHQK